MKTTTRNVAVRRNKKQQESRSGTTDRKEVNKVGRSKFFMESSFFENYDYYVGGPRTGVHGPGPGRGSMDRV